MLSITKKQKNQNGQIIIISVIIVAILTLIAGSLLTYTALQLRAGRTAISHNQTLDLAEAGLDKALYELNKNPSYAGEADTALGNGTFSITVSSIDSSNKRITATGYIPNSSSPTSATTVKASVSIDTSMVSFNFGVQVGAGGLNMNNNSVINGNVFSNGNISGNGTISGDVTVAGGTASTPDQEWTVQNANFNLGTPSTQADAAQSFIPTSSTVLNKVSLFLKKIGNPSNLNIKIVDDNGGKPNNSAIANGTATISASTVGSNYSFIDASFTNTPTLTTGQTYWIVADYSTNSSNYYVWGQDSTDSYTSGTGKKSSNWTSSNSWSSAGGDFDFKTFIGGVVTSISGVSIGGNARANTLTGCSIGRDAYFQNTNTCSVAGSQFSGTPDSAPQAMPISDAQISDWENDATAGGTIAGPYTINGTQTLGPKVIDGDLILNNGATLYLTGAVWVKGDITLSNNSTVRVDISLGNNSTLLLADNPANQSGSGLIDVSNNTILAGNNNPGSYLMLITTKSGSAMNVSNNATGAIFYSANGTINVSNNAGGNQLTGYGIQMNNNSTINYQTGLQSVTFTSGPGGSWRLTAGSYVILK